MADDADDFEPTRDHGARNAALALTVLALAGAAAWTVNHRFDGERRTRELQRAAGAWADLSRCLAGERYHVGEVSRVARHVEVGVPRAVRFLPANERARQWPWRCAPHARTLTRALFESRSEDPRHRLLNQFASRAATELERGALHTGRDDARRYLDELFAAAERAVLPAVPPSSVALPPAPARFLDPARVRPLFRAAGGATLAAAEPLEAGALRVLLGGAERRFCDFDRDLDAPDCQRVAALDRATRPMLTSAQYPKMPGYLRGDIAGVGALLHPRAPDAAPMRDDASGALRTAADLWIVATASRVATLPSYALVSDGVAPLPFGSAALSAPRMHGAVVLAWEALPAVASSGDGGTPDASADVTDASDGGVAYTTLRVHAGVVATSTPLRWELPFEPRGAVRRRAEANAPVVEAVSSSCRVGGDDVLAIYGDDDRALVLWHVHDGPLRAYTVDAKPGALTCDGAAARLAWYTDVPRPVVHVATCVASGCTMAEASAPTTETRPRVAALGAQVLLVYATEGNVGLRYRLATLPQLADAPESVVFDDGAHDGVDLEAAPTVLTRGEVAVLVVTRRDGPHETWAVRIDARGYRALRPAGDAQVR